jgi:hypothetical protein
MQLIINHNLDDYHRRDGELRHARYRLNVPLRAVRQVNVNEQGAVVEA